MLGRAQLNGDEWNLGVTTPAEGDVRMSMTSTGGLTVRGELPVAPPCTAATCLAPSANTWVRAYTNVSYGKNPCRAATSPASNPALRLPVKVSALPTDLVGTTSYSSQASQITYDIAYDMWLNPSGTQSPCRTQGTVEVMVWTDYDRQALLPTAPVASASIPYAVGGVVHDGTNAWSAYVINVHGSGRTSPYGGTVFLVLNAANVVPAGTVSVDVTKALSAVGGLLEQDYGWRDFASHYLARHHPVRHGGRTRQRATVGKRIDRLHVPAGVVLFWTRRDRCQPEVLRRGKEPLRDRLCRTSRRAPLRSRARTRLPRRTG